MYISYRRDSNNCRAARLTTYGTAEHNCDTIILDRPGDPQALRRLPALVALTKASIGACKSKSIDGKAFLKTCKLAALATLIKLFIDFLSRPQKC